VVGGGPTGFHPEDEGARIAAIASTEHVEIAEGGHMMHWTRPVELSALLVDFLRRGLG
jgi:pimeloyl-ACP methyl ester carboxylesterase